VNLPLPVARSRVSDIAIHSVYEVTKLLAGSSRPRERLPELLTLLSDFLELRDAGIAFQGETPEPELIGMQTEPPGAGRRRAALLDAALRRTNSTSMPWIVESEWGEPSLEGAIADQSDAELDASFVAVPIKEGGRVIGVLGIERAHGPGDQACFCFDSDVRLLTVIAHCIAQASRADAPKPGRAEAVLDPPPPASRATPARGRGSSDDRMSGSHPRWRATLERARVVARSSSTVLLRGECGTGKEVLARYIHETSPRADRPFVSVNCAALAESVLESELFGHEKGAFTGASTLRKGRFELADGGTLFLDEIGEISAAFQARLLRVLQLGEFERVGGMSTLKVDVRVLTATNRNLEHEVRSGRFRADLYYRISVVPLFLPALRDRPSDIPELANEFLARFNRSNGTHWRFDPSALEVLKQYSFPGNVRELENGVRRAASLAQGACLTEEDFAWLQEDTPLTLALRDSQGPPAPAASAAPTPTSDDDELPTRKVSEETSRERLIAALEQAGWVQAKAARLLGLTPRQIAYALQKHGIAVRKF
jgi:Nif-specific regulatory protein